MVDAYSYMVIAGACLAALSIVAVVGLRGWNGWLGLKHAELARQDDDSGPPSISNRIDLADLKERIRKLEAIAAGVDL